ncbi:collagen alpha-2(I) chain-like [Lutra lutra]|uniref:collagen alpha-2(I) chain-like n=1 Tax=Lutra lutra TaxID=9657 RepID=UPI001FD38CD5|nr:collagen alpha-2(I) chain-like [Lutra lutra]XP_047554676.1 collagen alpha-2(I) chain-like [Lutra lutra]
MGGDGAGRGLAAGRAWSCSPGGGVGGEQSRAGLVPLSPGGGEEGSGAGPAGRGDQAPLSWRLGVWDRAGRTWRRSGQVAAWAAGAGPRGEAWRASHLPGAVGRGGAPGARRERAVFGARSPGAGRHGLRRKTSILGSFVFAWREGFRGLRGPRHAGIYAARRPAARAAGAVEAGDGRGGAGGLSRGGLAAAHTPVSRAGPLPALRRRRPAPPSAPARASPTHK